MYSLKISIVDYMLILTLYEKYITIYIECDSSYWKVVVN